MKISKILIPLLLISSLVQAQPKKVSGLRQVDSVAAQQISKGTATTGQIMQFNGTSWNPWTATYLTGMPTLDQVTTAGNTTLNKVFTGQVTVNDTATSTDGSNFGAVNIHRTLTGLGRDYWGYNENTRVSDGVNPGGYTGYNSGTRFINNALTDHHVSYQGYPGLENNAYVNYIEGASVGAYFWDDAKIGNWYGYLAEFPFILGNPGSGVQTNSFAFKVGREHNPAYDNSTKYGFYTDQDWVINLFQGKTTLGTEVLMPGIGAATGSYQALVTDNTTGKVMKIPMSTGTVSSVNVAGSGALTFSGGPITTTGTISAGWSGSNTQYIRGDGTLATFPSATVVNDGLLSTAATGFATLSGSFSANQATNSTLTLTTPTSSTAGQLFRRNAANTGYEFWTPDYTSNTGTVTNFGVTNNATALITTSVANPTTTPQLTLGLTNATALSVLGRSANTAGAPDYIAASTDNTLLRRSGTAIGFGTIGNSYISDLAWSKITGAPSFITLTNLSATTPLTYNNTTGVFGITQASTSTNGFLSSTDWNTFNNKAPSTGGTGYIQNQNAVVQTANARISGTFSANGQILGGNIVSYTGLGANNDIFAFGEDGTRIQQNTGFWALKTATNTSHPMKVGGLTIANSYLNTNPPYGLFVEGQIRNESLGGGTGVRPVGAAADGTLQIMTGLGDNLANTDLTQTVTNRSYNVNGGNLEFTNSSNISLTSGPSSIYTHSSTGVSYVDINCGGVVSTGVQHTTGSGYEVFMVNQATGVNFISLPGSGGVFLESDAGVYIRGGASAESVKLGTTTLSTERRQDFQDMEGEIEVLPDGVPTVSVSNPSLTVSLETGSTNKFGQIIVTNGTGSVVSGGYAVTLTYSTPFPNKAFATACAGIEDNIIVTYIIKDMSATSFNLKVNSSSSIGAGTTHRWNYIANGN